MKTQKRFLIMSTGAFTAGFLNGLLGAGGGIILVLFLASALSGIKEKGIFIYEKQDMIAISLAVMIPVSAVSALKYAQRGAIDLPFIKELALPAILGGIAGGVLLSKIKEKTLVKIFSGVVIVSGLLMIVR